MPGVGVHVLDRRLQPVPPGCRGELYIAARSNRGYLGSASATAAKFVPDPFHRPAPVRACTEPATWHAGRRTGNRVLRPRGPPGEDPRFGWNRRVEACSITPRRAAPARWRARSGGQPQLVAYVTPSTLDPVRLKDFAAALLPAHAEPS